MIYYVQQGELPQKKHVTFHDPHDDKKLLWEELVGGSGFYGFHSTKYHHYLPTAVENIINLEHDSVVWEKDLPLQNLHFDALAQNKGDFLGSMSTFLGNEDILLHVSTPTKNQDYFYKNTHHHELFFIHEGCGTLCTEYGELKFSEGDYLYIPKATIYQFNFLNSVNRLLWIETTQCLRIPDEFVNCHGQLLEHAPYSERDFRHPILKKAFREKGEFTLRIRSKGQITQYTLPHHPFDVEGWDGYLFPFAFQVDDYCPIVGKLHQPPSVHKMFENNHMMITNFVPRLLDFHNNAIPVPYYHSNIDCEEILYYVKGNFMSRKGIEEGSITLHPSGVPHGPQPGVVENSLNKKEVNELAIMIDTYKPVYLSRTANEKRYTNYYKSWLST